MRRLGMPAAMGLSTAALLGAWGCSGASASTTTTRSTRAAARAVEKDGKLVIAANPNGRPAFNVKTATATAGRITISIANTSGVDHNVAIQRGTGRSGLILGATPVRAHGTQLITLKLKPGTYTFFSQVPGDRVAGMYGTLTVS